MKHSLTFLLLAIMAGCGDPQTEQQPNDQGQPSDDGSAQLQRTSAAEVPAEFLAKVIGVIDGDIIDVLTVDSETVRIRFNGIDAPERGQPFGNSAKQTLSASIAGKMVRVVSYGDDKYGRVIGDIYLDDTLINLALVQAGMAWHYVRSTSDRDDLEEAEKQARELGTGLWQGERKAIPPWQWRRMSKE